MENNDSPSQDSRAEPVATAELWPQKLQRLRALLDLGAIPTLIGFPTSMEDAYQRARCEAVRQLLRISMFFAILSYPIYLEFDRLTTHELQEGWVYAGSYGVATLVGVLVFALTFVPTRGPAFYRTLGLAVVMANHVTLIASSVLGILTSVPIPYEALMLAMLYLFFLLGLSIRLALPVAALSTIAYTVCNSLAGLPFHELVKRTYFLVALASMCTIGAALRELADRRAWASAEILRGFSERDGLTGLLNRGTFDVRAGPALRQARREGVPASLAVIDLDYFKQLNDQLGHPAGDQALRTVADLLGSAPPLRRPLDFSARLGGEEFAIFWYGAEPAWVERVLEDLLIRIRALRIRNPGGRSGVVTASIGLAHFTGKDSQESADLLLTRADEALYIAKNEGRDCLRLYVPR